MANRRQRSGSEGRFGTEPTSTFYLSSNGQHRPSLSVVIPTHAQGSRSPIVSPSNPRSRSPSLSSVAYSTSNLAASVVPPNYHSTIRGHVVGHRPMTVLTSGSATLPSHISPRGLPPKSRPSIIPHNGTNSGRMGTIKESTFLTSEQVSRV